MNVLFVAYCIGSPDGESLIGVYKRALRIGLEMARRGHRVSLLCPGRENFHDRMTARAERSINFLDWPLGEESLEGAAENYRLSLAAMQELAPQVVVIGEAPLDGALLEMTLCAAELRIPIVCLDNAHQPAQADLFLDHHGMMFDGVILNGPSSFYTADPPPYVVQVPPFIEAAPQRAEALLCGQLGLHAKKTMTILAYDRNVEELGASLFEKLADPELEAVFICPHTEACRDRLDRLPESLQDRLRVIPPLPDGEHFGLCQLSSLVICKCGFMQVSECLCLGTPILGFVYADGGFHLGMIPPICRSYAAATDNADADAETVAIARRLLALRAEDMISVHEGGLGAPGRAADFLERLPQQPRDGANLECAERGLTFERLLPALQSLHPGTEVEIVSVRMSLLRALPADHRIYTILCHFKVAGVAQCGRFWGRTFDADVDAARRDARDAKDPESPRQLHYLHTEDCYLIEKDIGSRQLPEIRLV